MHVIFTIETPPAEERWMPVESFNAIDTLESAVLQDQPSYGFWDRRFFLGAGFLFSSLMYWLSIRWIDRHGSWADDA